MVKASNWSNVIQISKKFKNLYKGPSSLSWAFILKGRGQRLSRPALARTFLKALNGLFAWAVEREFLAANPCYGIKYSRLTNSDGFAAWNEDDVVRYYSYYPLGERVYLDVLLIYRRGCRKKPKRQQTLDPGIIGNYTFIGSQRGQRKLWAIFRIACRKIGSWCAKTQCNKGSQC